MYFWITIFILIAYLLGSIPTSVWTGKILFGKDVRDYGSGNAGATNAFRILGKKTGIFVLIIDMLKGFIAAGLGSWAGWPGAEAGQNMMPWQLLTGIAAVVGHLYPVFSGFKGGKGVATFLGVILAIHTPAALSACAVFVLAFILTRIVSVGSVAAAVSFPLLLYFVFSWREHSLLIFAICIAVLICITHRENIKRLWHGTENKTVLFK